MRAAQILSREPEEIIQFAAGKLLNAHVANEKISNKQILARLSQRLPIYLYSTTYIAQARESRQVEGHLLVWSCLKIDGAFQSMVTTPSSEPLQISEAAYFIMRKPQFNVPHALKTVMEGLSISTGDWGEFLALLIFILACVEAVGDLGRPRSGKCQCPRGAGVLCANNQAGMDAITTFCDGWMRRLIQHNGGLILKNDPKFSTEPDPELFAVMVPLRPRTN
ncbi:hypothetical protein BYT27DRAFT_7257509 [Phlegmacium glaucopus]|nr:hypothetical protein BYT27DRAFT_7257509 [Phlegmacium glaucopus]